jgi:DNA polymerase-3 subunit epsilon
MSPSFIVKVALAPRPKSPRLAEAYEFFMGRSLQGAHSALADARGCLEIWNVMRGAAVEQAAPPRGH